MVLIFGGAYQGKKDFVLAQFGLNKDDICVCSPENAPDLTKKCLANGENLVLYCLNQRVDEMNYFRCNSALFEDKIFIFRDIFCGVVPMSKEERAWREATGRVMQYLAGRADRVSRVFCGLEQRLK